MTRPVDSASRPVPDPTPRGVPRAACVALALALVAAGCTSSAGRLGTPAGAPAACAPCAAPPPLGVPGLVAPPANTETYDRIVENAFVLTTSEPLSTFSVDVDTASYSNVRCFLAQGQHPPAGAVRTEELVNYFAYDDAPPSDGRAFAASLEIAACPWAPAHRIVRIGIKARELPKAARPPANLVFLVDVSGSMADENKLPLVKQSLKALVDELDGRDRVSLVVYAGASGLVLPPTPADRKRTIRDAIDALDAGGSTNGAAGLELAYLQAKAAFVPGGSNRVVLATDGDFNVGITDQSTLVATIEEKAKSGIALTCLGFGMGNLKDSTLEKLADHGDGNYGYVDDLKEAEKLLVRQASGTLFTVAKDVKLQVEFNPALVAAYRLIGYENRLLAKQDFNDDAKDAGDVGAGHTVTALYELVAPGTRVAAFGVDPLRYQATATLAPAAATGELLTVKIRHKIPGEPTSRLDVFPLPDPGPVPFERASERLRFACAVAAFGMILNGSAHKGTADLAWVRDTAKVARGRDPDGDRRGFLELVEQARALLGRGG
jgi:Ca-activated chloride channel family protein